MKKTTFDKELEGKEIDLDILHQEGQDFFRSFWFGENRIKYFQQDVLNAKNQAKKNIIEEIESKKEAESVEVDFNSGLEVAKKIIEDKL